MTSYTFICTYSIVWLCMRLFDTVNVNLLSYISFAIFWYIIFYTSFPMLAVCSEVRVAHGEMGGAARCYWCPDWQTWNEKQWYQIISLQMSYKRIEYEQMLSYFNSLQPPSLSLSLISVHLSFTPCLFWAFREVPIERGLMSSDGGAVRRHFWGAGGRSPQRRALSPPRRRHTAPIHP